MRYYFLFFLVSTLLNAKETVEVFAEHVVATEDQFDAVGDVLILYNNSLLKSKKAHYDKNSSLLTLDGNVEMIGENENRVSSEHLVLDTSTKAVEFQQLHITADDGIWINASRASKKEEVYKIYDSRLSSCDPVNPDWTIDFGKATYYKDDNYMTLKDASLSFFDQKVFYFPFFAFPTLNERTTGLLFPNFKYSSTEGFAYEQPIFYVPTENIDVEFNPQVRTQRGFGGHVTTRFVDSNHSQGEFRTGYFKNYDTYAEKNELNNEHYGFEFLYNSTDFLPKSDFFDHYKSGLYVNSTYLNDLEYLNLQKNTASSLISSNLIESRMNAFVYDSKNYMGLYGKYYIDMSKENNKETIQELPTLHYHKYMEYLISNKLFFTFDARMHNYTRAKGSRARQMELELPLTYYDSFFNDYLDFSFSENLYLSKVSFARLDSDSRDYSYYRNYHTIELSSDLSKQYGNTVHTIHPSLVYVNPRIERETPTSYNNLEGNQKELFVTQTKKEQFSLGVSQYFYDRDLDMNLFHRLAWSQFPKDQIKQGDINNEFGYENDSLSLYSNLFYSLDEKKVHTLTSSLSYNQSNYDIMLTHFYNNDFLIQNESTSFVNMAFTQNYNKHNQWYFDADYDLKKSFNHQWHIGWAHKQNCWGAKVSFGQETIPNIDKSFRNSMVFFEVSLNPLGAVSQNIEKEFSSQGR